MGRAREYEKLTQREVYESVLRTNAVKSKDAKFIRTKWVDTQKGEDVRCRFVGQEFASRRSEGRPFREHSTFVLGEDSLCPWRRWKRARPWSLMALDVSCACPLRQGSPGDLHRAPLRRSASSRRDVRGSLKESPVRDTGRTTTLAEGAGEHAERSWIQRYSSTPKILLS